MPVMPHFSSYGTTKGTSMPSNAPTRSMPVKSTTGTSRPTLDDAKYKTSFPDKTNKRPGKNTYA